MSNILLFLSEVSNSTDWNFSMQNYEVVWKFLVQMGLVLIFLLIGNLLRTTVPFIRKSLIPSALIGGLLLLIVNIVLGLFGITLIDKSTMQVITYHGLGIGFIAMTLKNSKPKGKVAKVKMFENGILTGGAYMLQAFLGLGATIIFYLCTKDSSNSIYYGSGLLLPLGFGQGPGNALTWDINFSNLLDANGQKLFAGNGSFGLTIASVGFIVASLFGILYINIYKRRGLIKVRQQTSEIREVCEFEEENEIPDSDSVDKFSIQLGFVFLTYAISFLFMIGLGAISNFTNNIAWGFNFIWGVIFATLIKVIINKLTKKKIIKKKYINNYQMDRISGFAFDAMIVAGVAAIEIEEVKRYIWPLIVLCVIGTISTYIYLRKVTKHCFKGYEHEMFLTNFGTVTGTASNGMILLKELDPNYITPTSNLFVLSQFPAMICVAPLLLLLDFASKSFTNSLIAFGIFFALFMVYTIFLFRRRIFKNKYKEPVEIWEGPTN